MRWKRIVGGRVVDVTKECVRDNCEILIDDQTIHKMMSQAEMEKYLAAADIDPAQIEVIDACGQYVCPGLVDVHVHFRDPGFTYKEDIHTGSLAAAAGGVTSVILMANTNPVVDNAETLAYIMDKAAQEKIHIYTCVSVTKGLAGEALTDMKALIRQGAVGVTDDGIPLMDADLLREAMLRSRELGVPISLHEEDKTLITNNGINDALATAHFGIGGSPAQAEVSLVERDLQIALEEDAILNIQHISSAQAVELVRQAKKKSDRIHAEATPHHIALTQEAVLTKGTLAKMNPPLRTEEDRQAIIAGLKDGTIDLIATDHAPHSIEEKEKELTKAPSGILGLETMLTVCYQALVKEGHMEFPQMLAKMTEHPARMYGIAAGVLAEGRCADICFFNPNLTWVYDKSASKSSNSPFLHETMQGQVTMTMSAGEMIYSVEK